MYIYPFGVQYGFKCDCWVKSNKNSWIEVWCLKRYARSVLDGWVNNGVMMDDWLSISRFAGFGGDVWDRVFIWWLCWYKKKSEENISIFLICLAIFPCDLCLYKSSYIPLTSSHFSFFVLWKVVQAPLHAVTDTWPVLIATIRFLCCVCIWPSFERRWRFKIDDAPNKKMETAQFFFSFFLLHERKKKEKSWSSSSDTTWIVGI